MQDKGYTDTPSNRLYHGEVTTFFTACREMVAQYRQEAQWIRTKYCRDFPEDGAQGLAEMQGYITTVEQCREEYAAALRQMEQDLAVQWAQREDEISQGLAEALQTGDYSRLAL